MKTLYQVTHITESFSLMENSKHIEADSNIHACRKYLAKNGIDKTPIRSGAKDVCIKVEPFYINKDGIKYFCRNKKCSWYKLI